MILWWSMMMMLECVPELCVCLYSVTCDDNTIILWWFYDDTVMILWWYYDDTLMILWRYYVDIVMILWWYCDDTLMILWRYYVDTLMILWWYCDDTVTILCWYSDDSMMILWWYYDDTMMIYDDDARMCSWAVCLSIQRDLSRPLRLDDVDTSSSVLMPFYDHDTHIVYLAGKVRQSLTVVMSRAFCGAARLGRGCD